MRKKHTYTFSHWEFSWSAGMKVRKYVRDDGVIVTLSRKRVEELENEGRIK